MRRWLLLVALIGMLLRLGGQESSAQGGGFPRTVIDSRGAPITVPARPQIVAALGDVPGLALLLPPERIRPVDPSTPPTWTDIGLLVLPDLYAAAYPALIQSAQAAGVPVLCVTLPASLDAWDAEIELLGYATGQDVEAAHFRRRLDAQRRLVRALVAGRTPIRVLVLTPEGYTFGQGALITDVIAAAGGINVAAQAGLGDFRQINDADLRALVPDAILLSPAWDAEGVAAFATQPAYAGVPALQAGRVFRLPFSPTLPADPGWALVWLAGRLHPEAAPVPG